jgi:hypothetical protein
MSRQHLPSSIEVVISLRPAFARERTMWHWHIPDSPAVVS